jgi:hypothetical protein
MNVVKHEVNGTQVAEMRSNGIIMRSARDAADIIKQLLQVGVNKLILHEKNLSPEMWQVSNGLAETVLKEFNKSGVAVAFVGEFDLHKDKSLKALIHESNLGNRVFFTANAETAKAKLSESK